MSKSSENIIKSAEAATDPKALSAAAETSGPEKSKDERDTNNDGKVTLTERVAALEKLVNDLGKEIIDLKASLSKAAQPDNERPAAKVDHSLVKRVEKLEQRLVGVVSE